MKHKFTKQKMNNTLEISNLRKDYGDFLLKDISLTLPTGYIMGLVGPNGAGKTTIIKIIMNLIMKDGGQVNVFGKDHSTHEIAIKQRIGFVYDSPNYYDHLNLKRIKNAIAPFYDNWDDNIFQDLVHRFDLPLTKSLGKFSKGMAMKAAIAIALSHHADFIIMDEPTSGLDPVVRREVLDYFRELMEDENKAILFSSHITSDIEQVADYITYVLNGQVVFSKTKDEIFEEYALVKGGNELIDADTQKAFVGIRKGEYGFEALTNDLGKTKALFEDQVVIDKATLEDILFFSNQQAKKNR